MDEMDMSEPPLSLTYSLLPPPTSVDSTSSSSSLTMPTRTTTSTTMTKTKTATTPFRNTVPLNDVVGQSSSLSSSIGGNAAVAAAVSSSTTTTTTTTSTTDLLATTTTTPATAAAAAAPPSSSSNRRNATNGSNIVVRSRNKKSKHHFQQQYHSHQSSSTHSNSRKHHHHRRGSKKEEKSKCCNRTIVRSTLSCMNLLAKVLVWCSAIASVAAVVWYSYELKNNGTDPHLIAWFSAGAFVLLGFPISMYGIVMHLAHYNQPNVQCYVVRILWMVPIYSIESWLCLRYKDYAIYIETLRDWYESYVLYSFLQFLIQVLGGEDALILMLKDKSPTRGVHMWGLQYCGLKPWLMGQPVRRTYDNTLTLPKPGSTTATTTTAISITPILTSPANATATPTISTADPITPTAMAATPTKSNITLLNSTNNSNNTIGTAISNISSPTATTPTTMAATTTTSDGIRYKRVHWTSPFFVYCKFGVLQYVLLKFVCSLVVVVLEKNHLYKEGDFTYKGGYLYICILTNLSQCWALYCLIFFYYATKNELSPIRPVGKFLSVKALVFFTWWQSVCISILYQYNLIPHYHAGSNNNSLFGLHGSTVMEDGGLGDNPYEPLSEDAALALDEWGGNSFASPTSAATPSASATSTTIMVTEWTSEDVAKGLQDYLICIEMFVAAVVHMFIFSHTEYDPQAVEARERALNQLPHSHFNKQRLGRKWKDWDNKSAYSGTTMTSSEYPLMEMAPILPPHQQTTTASPPDPTQQTMYRTPDGSVDEDDLRVHPLDRLAEDDDPNTTPDKNEDDDDLDDDEDNTDSSFYSMESSDLNDDDDSNYDDENDDEEQQRLLPSSSAYSKRQQQQFQNTSASSSFRRKPTGFVKALLDSAIPQDLRDNTVGIIKGDYVVERKTLLHHAATSDSYDLFSRVPKLKKKTSGSVGTNNSTTTANNNVGGTTMETTTTTTNKDNNNNIINNAI